jgi:FKBP-type peptidyl-prolyl cis-trans isomerase FkpA
MKSFLTPILHRASAWVSSLLLILSMCTMSCAADITNKTEEQKTLYAVGLIIARQLSVFNLSPTELDIVKQGLMDASTGKIPEVELSAYNEKVQELARARRKYLGEKQAAANKEFLDKAAQEKGAVKTDSGLVYISLSEGSGTGPNAADIVKVDYRGTLIDGKEFDSSYKRGKPIEFRLDSVIKCWTEGLQKMKTGGKARLICPSSTAYGDTGNGELILPGATLLFEVELLDVKK